MNESPSEKSYLQNRTSNLFFKNFYIAKKDRRVLEREKNAFVARRFFLSKKDCHNPVFKIRILVSTKCGFK